MFMFDSLKRCETCHNRLLLHNIGKATLCLDRGPHPVYTGSPGTYYGTDDKGERHSERLEFWESQCSADRSYNRNISAPVEVYDAIKAGASSARVQIIDGILGEVAIYQ